MRRIQREVAETLEKLTALHLASLDITVRSIVINGAEYP